MKGLIVYYSRSGVTEKLALAIKDEMEAELIDIQESKSRSGLTGCLKASWESFAERLPDIDNTEDETRYNISEYDIVIIGTPIWAGNMSSPVRSFIAKYRDDFQRVAFFCTFGVSGAENAFNNMEILTGRVPEGKLSLRKKEVQSDNVSEKIRSFLNSFEIEI